MNVDRYAIIGTSINGFEIVDFVGIINNNAQYIFKCHCGANFQTRLDYIKRGHTKSCGCFRKARMSTVRTKKKERKSDFNKMPESSPKKKFLCPSCNKVYEYSCGGVFASDLKKCLENHGWSINPETWRGTCPECIKKRKGL